MVWDSIYDQLFSETSNFYVTGGLIKSINLCSRQAWFHYNNIDLKSDHSFIQIGNQIEKRSYSGDESQIIDGVIAPDKIDSSTKTIFETKKSSGAMEATRKQVQYYLWYLRETRSEDYTGKIRIPSEKKTYDVELTDESIEELKESIIRLYNLWKSKIPEFNKKDVCKNCAYKDICWPTGDINYE